MKLLLDRDANIRAKNNHGDTALMQAAVSGKTEVVKLLQDKGSPLNFYLSVVNAERGTRTPTAILRLNDGRQRSVPDHSRQT